MASSTFWSSSSKSSFDKKKQNTNNNHHHKNNSNHHSITGSSVQLIRSANISISNVIFPNHNTTRKKRQPKQKRFQLDLILCLWDGPLNNTALLWQQPESASSSLPPPLSLISKQSSKCLPMWHLPCRLSLELDNIWHWLHHLHKKTTTLIIFCHCCRMWWSCCCRHRCNTWREMPIIIIL